MSMLVNPYGFRGATPAYFTTETLGPTNIPPSSGGSTYYPTATLTVTAGQQQANATYVGIWTFDHESNNTNVGISRLNKNSGTILTSQNIYLKDSTPLDRHTMGGIFFHAAGAVPATATFTIEHSKSGSGTTTVYNARLSLLKLGPNDLYAENLPGLAGISATTPQDLATLALPGGPYDWLVLGGFHSSQGNGTTRYDLTDGTTTTGTLSPSTKGLFSETIPIQTGLYLPGKTGVTVRLRGWTSFNAFPMTPSAIRLVAIRLDRFVSVSISPLGAANAGTDTSYTTGHSQTFTPSASDHLIIGCGAFGANSDTISIGGRFMDGATEVNQFTREAVIAGDSYPVLGHRIAALPNASRTQSLDRISETSGVTNTIQARSFLAALNLAGLA